MARRCGCSGTCGCVVAGGAGITVTGNGSIANPIVVSFTGGAGAACEAVMDCVGANIGNGMVYDPVNHRLSVLVSGDAGNTTVIGSDGGIYSSGSGGGSSGGVTVAQLAASNLIGGQQGMAFLYPENGVGGFEMARNLNIPLTSVDVRVLRDGTLVASAPTDISTLTDGTGLVSTQWAARWERLRYDAYNWFGWNQDDFDKDTQAVIRDDIEPVKMPFVEDIFRAVGGDTVLVCNIQTWTAPFDPGARLLTAISRHGLQLSTIVTSTVRTELAPFTAANIATGMVLRNTGDVTANTPAQIVSAGIGWVFAARTLSDAQISSYVAVGLSVMVTSVERQRDRTRAVTTLAARGILSRDPIYASADTSKYRLTANIWETGTGNMPVAVYYGHLTAGTDSGLLAPANRADANSDEDSIIYPASFNGLILQGWACPLANPTAYTLKNWIQFQSIPGGGQLGNVALSFGYPTDPAPSAADITNTALDLGYKLEFYSDGGWKLWRADGTSGDTVLGSAGAGTWNGGLGIVGSWFETQLQVTATQIILKVLLSGVLTTIFTINSSTYRGGYWYLGKNNRSQSYITRSRNQTVI